MKKIFILFTAMVMALTVSAQYVKNYDYNFWSNWSIGASAMFTKDYNMNNWVLGQDWNIGLDARLNKKVGQHWDARILFNYPGFMQDTANGYGFDKYSTLMAGASWTPWNHLYVFGDAGFGFNRGVYGYWAVAMDAGIGVKGNLGEHFTMYSEIGTDAVANILDFDSEGDMDYNAGGHQDRPAQLSNLFAKVGIQYNFGPTRTDKAIIIARRTLESDIDYRDTIKNLKKVNQKLRDTNYMRLAKIEQLEEHDSVMHSIINDLMVENGELRELVRNTASTATIYFDFASSDISYTEMDKIRSIARIINEDKDVTYVLEGNCSSAGHNSYNKRLSINRANAVKQALIDCGIDESRLEVIGNGELQTTNENTQRVLVYPSR